ncbi:MAG: O-antigen ligase family protein [Candidatus Aminicenantales bacterium]
MVLIVFMLISVLWSNIPNTSFNRWVRELQAVLMAFVVLSEPSPRQSMESILRRTTYILIPFSLLLIKFFPNYGRTYGRWSGRQMWIGVTQQKNGLGRLCLIAVFFLIWSLVRRKQGNNAPVWKYQTHVEILVLVIALLLIRGPGGDSYSATALYALGVGLLVYWGFHFIKKFGINLGGGTLMTTVAMIILFGIVAVFSSGSNVRFFASSVGRDATLTGRTQVWARLLPVAMQQPVVGRGFGGFWTPRTREAFEISEGHSGYLDVLLGLGFVGILLVSIFLLSSCRKAQRVLFHDFDWGALWICYIIMSVVHNITESSIDSLTSQLTAVLVFLAISSSKAAYAPRDSQEKYDHAT